MSTKGYWVKQRGRGPLPSFRHIEELYIQHGPYLAFCDSFAFISIRRVSLSCNIKAAGRELSFFLPLPQTFADRSKTPARKMAPLVFVTYFQWEVWVFVFGQLFRRVSGHFATRNEVRLSATRSLLIGSLPAQK